MEVYVIFTYNVYNWITLQVALYFRYEITSKTLKSTFYKVNVFCKIHEIWVKTFEDIAPRTVPDRQTDRLTWVIIELLVAAKMHKAWMTCAALYRHYTKNSWSDRTIHIWDICMMTSSNGNIFRVTDHLCGEFTGPRWIPRTKASDAELWCFLWSAPE